MPLPTVALSTIAGLLINDGSFTPYNAANAYLGVGNSATAFAAGQTNLVGGSTDRVLVSTAPLRSGAQLTFVALFGVGDANFAWLEWGTFNHASAGQMLNRKVESFGTKTSSEQWELTVTVTPVLA